MVNRRKFIKRGALFVPMIFVPKLLRAGPPFTHPSYWKRQLTGGGEPPGTSLVTSTPSGSPRNNFEGCVGLYFTTPGGGLTVSALSRWVLSGNSGTHTVRIVNFSLETEVASVSINTTGATSNAFKWATITPVALAGSTRYCLASTEVNGGDQWLDDHAATIATGTGLESAYSAGCAAFAGFASDHSFVGVNLKY